MPDIFVTNEEARALLKAHCQGHGSTKAIVQAAGVSPSYISLMKNGLKPISGQVGALLGLRAVRGFVQNKRE